MLSFDPKDRPSAEEALADPYFRSLLNVDREPSTQPISKLVFEFEQRKLAKEDVRELIYREIKFIDNTDPAGIDHNIALLGPELASTVLLLFQRELILERCSLVLH